MKKKIINGILMAAMLFAGTTSFVSCKDNVDDVATSIYKDLDKVKSDLQLQIDALSGRVSTLEGKVSTLEGKVSTLEGKVSTLEAEVEQIQKDIKALDGRVGNLEEEQTKLKDRMKAAEAKIAELEEFVNNAIYDVKVEETIDAVIGSINLPGISVPTLMSYYGLNASGITTFPTKKSNVHVYNNDGGDAGLINGQYASQIDPFVNNSVNTLRFEGLGAQLSQYANNVGKIYFSVNPVGVDLTGVTFDLIDSKGNVYPYEISDVKSSDHDLTFALGKHGEIINEGETQNPNLYEANVHLPMAKWQEAISYNLDDTWKVLGNMSEISSMVEKVKAAKTEGGKTEASKVLIKEALQWLQNQYQKTYQNKYKMKYQALRATGKVNVAKSSTKIVVAAVEPLSYKTFWELDNNGKQAIKGYADVEAIEKAVAALVKVTGKKVADIKNGITSDGSTVTIDGKTVNVGELTAAQIQVIINNIPYANNVLEKMKKIYKASNEGDYATLQTSASNFLSKVSAKIASVAGDHWFFNIVTPIVLFQGAEGIDRLSPGLTIDANASTYKLNVILTSPTEEYLVPAMYKYIAVRQGDKLLDAKILQGNQKVTDIQCNYGECEIIYQTVDYAGYVVTKSYPVTIK